MSVPALDPDLLRAFVAVAEHRSFTRAAAALNRTQSAVSMQVKRLEERLDVALFQRSTARVMLSPAGESLLGYAQRILALSDEAIGRLRDHRLEGTVRLGVMDDYGTLVLPRLLASFAAAHPRVHVEMETGLTAGMPGRLGSGYDLVLAMHPRGSNAGTFLRREQPLWVASPAHRIEALDPLPVALYPQGCLFRQWALAALEASGRRFRIAFVSHSLAAVTAIAAEGLAVTVVKAGTRPQGLRIVAERDGLPPLPEADICLHRAGTLAPAAAALADHLTAALRAAA